MPDTHDDDSESAPPVCSTTCDEDCDAVCHEDHVAGHKRQHWPYDCPAADRYGWGGSDFIAVAVKRLRGERDGAREQLAELGRPATEYRFLLADGRESEIELHNEGPCGCRREQRTVHFGTWRAASVAAQDSPSDPEPCRGCGETYCDDSREAAR